MAEMSKKQNALQALKFALFSASAGIIQVVSFTLLNEVVVPNINIQNEADENPQLRVWRVLPCCPCSVSYMELHL